MRFLLTVGAVVLFAACGSDEGDVIARGYLIDGDEGLVMCAEQSAVCPADATRRILQGFAVTDLSNVDFLEIDNVQVSRAVLEARASEATLTFVEVDDR
ncbi:MAG: hypothetical protein AAGA90_20855 [Actinomycetota bacterium]